jgi:putative FmdB family regulatory protein
MPLYEYKCDECGALIERLMRVNEQAPDCERCDGEMSKQVSRSSFTLRGSGWARDNYGLTNTD